MGLFSTIASTLGLRRPVALTEMKGLVVTRRAEMALSDLPNGQCLRLQTLPADGAFEIQFVLSAPQNLGPSPHPRLLLPSIDAPRVAHLELDHVGGHWLMKLTLKLQCDETPNPNGRKYRTNLTLHSGTPTQINDRSSAHYLARRLLTHQGILTLLFHHNSFTIERRPDIPWKQLDHFVERTIREALLRCAPMIVDAADRTQWSPFEHAVWECIERSILPNIHKDGGDLQLIEIVDGEVRVTLRGACASCPASTLTLKAGVERTLNDAFPEHNLTVVAI